VQRDVKCVVSICCAHTHTQWTYECVKCRSSRDHINCWLPMLRHLTLELVGLYFPLFLKWGSVGEVAGFFVLVDCFRSRLDRMFCLSSVSRMAMGLNQPHVWCLLGILCTDVKLHEYLVIRLSVWSAAAMPDIYMQRKLNLNPLLLVMKNVIFLYLTVCRSYLQPYCVGRKTMLFSGGI
jgi:hypothetical protein